MQFFSFIATGRGTIFEGAAGHTWSTRLGEESACVRQEFDGEETPRQPLTAKVWDF